MRTIWCWHDGSTKIAIAQITNCIPGEFIWTGGDCHIYQNHIEQVKLQLSRTYKKLPTLNLNPHIKNIDDFKYEDIKILDYDFHPHIPGKVAI